MTRKTYTRTWIRKTSGWEGYGQLLFSFFQLFCDFQDFHNKCVLLSR